MLDLYLGSLIPIAAAYAISHYFSLLLIQGQFAITLALGSAGPRLGLVRHRRLPAEHRPRLTQHDLVRAGGRARGRARPRARGRA